jgi:hypothetical protein
MNPTGYAVNSLIRPIRSLFGRLEYPVPVAQGIRGNVLEMLCELASGSAAMAGIFEIRCYFPCYLGIRRCRSRPSRLPTIAGHDLNFGNAVLGTAFVMF